MDNRNYFGARKETLDRLSVLYKAEYFADEQLSEKRSKMYIQEIERIRKHFDFFEKGGKVLDIGCGRGEFLSLFGDKWEKYGIEISEFGRECSSRHGIKTDFDLRDDFFDLIIYRGTIQHIPDPIHRIEESYYWLRKGGGITFLSTPNTNSIVYKLFNDLPMIDEKYNFLLPSDKMLRQILTNFGFCEIEFEYPYLKSPYARPIKDVISLLACILRIKKKVNFPFFGNVMECYARKI